MQKCDYDSIIDSIRSAFNSDEFLPLHAPVFSGKERDYVLDTIESTFVSSVGAYVDRFENELANYVGSKYAIATVNGTSALHMALLLAGVEPESEVITQSMTFVATCNAIRYCNAHPTFVDISNENLGLCPDKLLEFLSSSTERTNSGLRNKHTNRIIKACLPMHTFGHSASIDKIVAICNDYGLPVVEDAAESLGSRYNKKHTGTFGLLGTFSFNGNKILTSGGGGMIVTDDEAIAKKAKHLTTTAKLPHQWNYEHDMVAYNYRLPNLNAALGCAQLEQLDLFISKKRELAAYYQEAFSSLPIECLSEPKNCFSNYWLNAILFNTKTERDMFLTMSNEQNVMTRPCWTLMNKLSMFNTSYAADLSVSKSIEDRLVNIPSSVIL